MLVRTVEGMWTEADVIYEDDHGGYVVAPLPGEEKLEVSRSCGLLATAKIIPATPGFYSITLLDGKAGKKEFFKKTIIAWAIENVCSTPITCDGPEMDCDAIVDPVGLVSVPCGGEWYDSVDNWLDAENDRATKKTETQK